MAIKMTAHFCGAWDGGKLYQGHDYTVTFATEAQAIEYISGKQSTTNFYERDDSPLDEREHKALLELLHPTCEHGMDAAGCYGPGHYMPDGYR